MTLDTNEPTDQRLVSELPGYIRANRVAINSITGSGGGVANNDLTIPGGTTSLTVGTELSAEAIETIKCTGAAASTLLTVLGGTEGQIKIFVFQDNNVNFTDGLKSGGAFYLNQLPALSNYNAQQDDVLVLINIGGDGTAANYGYWKELYRTLSVK